jgi:hypothetical protein
MERATTIGRSHDLLIVPLLLFAQSQRISFAAGSYGFMSSVGIQGQPKLRPIFTALKLEPFLEPRAFWTWNRKHVTPKKLH